MSLKVSDIEHLIVLFVHFDRPFRNAPLVQTNWAAGCIHSASLLGSIHRGKNKCTTKKWLKNSCQERASAEEAHWRLNEMKPSLTGPKFYRGESTSCSEPSHSSSDSMSNCLNPVVDESLDSPAATAAPTQSRDRFILANKHSAPEQVTKCAGFSAGRSKTAGHGT